MEAAAVSLQSAYERAEASLDLASQRMESEFSRSCTDQRLNPARLMRRIRALQDELPKLQKAAAANATAEREIMDGLREQLASNHKATLELAARAGADVAAEAAQWEAAMSSLPDTCEDDNYSEHVAYATGGADVPPTPSSMMSQTREPDPLAPTAEMQIPEANWLRLDAKQRAGHTLADTNEFWVLLQGLFVRRGVREVSAAQLLALGVRMHAENKAKLRLLEQLGLLQLSNNSVSLA